MTKRRGQRRPGEGKSGARQTALILPLLTLGLGCLLHLGLYVQSRAVTTEAVQQGLTAASALDGTTTSGRTIVRQFLTDQAPVEILGVSVPDAGGRVTVAADVRSPALVPGLPDTLNVTLSAAKEQWVAP